MTSLDVLLKSMELEQKYIKEELEEKGFRFIGNEDVSYMIQEYADGLLLIYKKIPPDIYEIHHAYWNLNKNENNTIHSS